MTETTAERYIQLWIDSYDGTPRQPPHSVYQFITSNIHQTGKTSWALRNAEVILERLKGWKFDPDNIAFDIATIMERRKAIHRFDQQVLDEPQRVAGNRTWQDIPQQVLAEDLQSTNRYLKPVFFPTPHSHLVDNAIYGICTSQAVIPSLGRASLYYLDRDQLNRFYKTRTPVIGSMTFSKPNAILWHEYNRRFDEYYEKRQAEHLELVKGIQKEAQNVPSILTVNDLEALINADPQAYIDRHGSISVSKVRDKHKVPYNRAQEAAGRVNLAFEKKRQTEKAEKEAI